MFRELSEGDGDDRNGEHGGTEAVQVGERALELASVVHPANEDDLRVERDPPLGKPSELRDDVRRLGVAEQPAADGRVRGMHRAVHRWRPMLARSLDAPRL